MEDPSAEGSLETTGATEAEGATGGQGGVVTSAPRRGTGEGGEAAMNFISRTPSSRRPAYFRRRFRTSTSQRPPYFRRHCQNVSSRQPYLSSMQALPPFALPQHCFIPHQPPSQEHLLGSLQWQQHQEQPQPHPQPQSSMQSQVSQMTFKFQDQLHLQNRQELFAAQTPTQLGQQSQLVNQQSIQADSSSQLQREPDINLHQFFSSPEAIQSLLSEREELEQSLERNPVLMKMLQDRFRSIRN